MCDMDNIVAYLQQLLELLNAGVTRLIIIPSFQDCEPQNSGEKSFQVVFMPEPLHVCGPR